VAWKPKPEDTVVLESPSLEEGVGSKCEHAEAESWLEVVEGCEAD